VGEADFGTTRLLLVAVVAVLAAAALAITYKTGMLTSQS